MTSKAEEQGFRFDGLKWLFVVALIAAGIFANSYYSDPQRDVALLYRVIALLMGGAVAAFVAVQTEKGSAFTSLVREAMVEVKKVVWPTVPETNQTTLIILLVVLFMAIVLWALDTFFGWVASLILG
jgi:preprotein translocase subunit SecE